MTEHDRCCAVYRCFDADGRLLYVGSSERPVKRWGEHRRNRSATWTDSCVTRTVEWFDSGMLAYAAEGRAILNEKPVHNQRCPRFHGRYESDYGDLWLPGGVPWL